MYQSTFRFQTCMPRITLGWFHTISVHVREASRSFFILTIYFFHIITGLEFLCGHLLSRGEIAQNDAECVRLLKEAGAIVIATTSVPQLSLWWETYSPIRGTTRNPYDFRRVKRRRSTYQSCSQMVLAIEQGHTNCCENSNLQFFLT